MRQNRLWESDRSMATVNRPHIRTSDAKVESQNGPTVVNGGAGSGNKNNFPMVMVMVMMMTRMEGTKMESYSGTLE